MSDGLRPPMLPSRLTFAPMTVPTRTMLDGSYNRNLRTPYVETWNIDIQHSFTNNLSLDVAYLGNHGTKIFGTRDINAPASRSWVFSRKPSDLR